MPSTQANMPPKSEHASSIGEHATINGEHANTTNKIMTMINERPLYFSIIQK